MWDIVEFIFGEDIRFETLNDVEREYEVFFLMFFKKNHMLEMTFSDDRKDKDPNQLFFPRSQLTEAKQLRLTQFPTYKDEKYWREKHGRF